MKFELPEQSQDFVLPSSNVFFSEVVDDDGRRYNLHNAYF